MPKQVDMSREAEIGSLVRRIRRNAKLTQEELAEKTNVSFQQVQKYERGANRITVSKFIDIARACNVAPAIALGVLDLEDDRK